MQIATKKGNEVDPYRIINFKSCNLFSPLNLARYNVDSASMGTWLSKIRKAISPEPESVRRVRGLLSEAYSARTKLELELLNQPSFSQLVLVASIEDVREREIIISQPLMGTLNHPLAAGEHFRLLFTSKSAGYLSGKTESLGRIQIASGGRRVTYGYRMSLPASLRVEDRRKKSRLNFGSGPPPSAALYSRLKSIPLRGTVQDVTSAGMLIRVLHKGEIELALGQKVHLSVALPEPVGSINVGVTVVRLAPSSNRVNNYVGVSFVHEIEGLETLIDRLQKPQNDYKKTG